MYEARVAMDIGPLLALAILLIVYAMLVTEYIHRTAAAVIGAATVLALNVALRYTTFEDLFSGVDIDTVLLLMSMMMIVSVLSRTRVFEYLAFKVLEKFYASPMKLLIAITGFTAAVSAFVDNVTTVLFVAPIAVEVCRKLDVDPRPLLISIALASNIGGTATLIGDPPNILIGSYAGLGFMDFIRNLTPIVIADYLLFIIVTRALISRWIGEVRRSVAMKKLTSVSIEVDRSLLRRTLIALSIAIALFFLEDVFEYPPAIPAMVGASILLLATRRSISIEEVVRGVDWPTLVFFIAMFILIRGVERLGLLDAIASGVCAVSSSLAVAIAVVVWISTAVSAVVDNIPYVMSMLPVIPAVATSLGVDPTPLYWALSLGACLGGNATIVGASANIVVAGIAEKQGYPITFKRFAKMGIPITIATVGLSTLYLLARYT